MTSPQFNSAMNGASPPSVARRLHRAAGPLPFGGTPTMVPGLVEAENFDDGGNGVGYHDTTAGNAGGQYRAGDVDIEVHPTPEVDTMSGGRPPENG